MAILVYINPRISSTNIIHFFIHLHSYITDERKEGSFSMHFEDQEEQLKEQSQTFDSASKAEELLQNLYEGGEANAETIPFRTMSKLFTALSEARGGLKSRLIKKFLTTLFKMNRKWNFTFSIMRLIVPNDDKDRGNYGLKQKALAKLLTTCLTLNNAEYDRLYHYKNPNYHREGQGIGDFSICMYDVIKDYLKSTSTLTVKRLNEILDMLANSSEQQKWLRELLNESNAAEMKWIIRIILKDLKLGIKIETVLTTFHPDGNQYFNLTGSLLETTKKFQNPKVSLNDQVQLFHPIRPMLAGKKKIEYFKHETRTFYLETKYDGQRLQVHCDREKIKLFSRNGVDYNFVYEDFLCPMREAIKADACILDGEIIVIDTEDKKMMPFGLNKTVALNHETENLVLCYKIFDIQWLKVENEEMNLMVYPLRERKKILPKVINEIPGRVEIVKFREILEYDDILKQFNASLERNEEGIMLKDPNSIYVPKERAINWLKLKGDYVDGMTDTMDVIILGGYFGDLSFRLGKEGHHWTNQVTSFLVGVLQNTSEEGSNSKIVHALPFARIGTGFAEQDLIQLRARLKEHLYQYNGKNKPDFMRCQWKYTIQNKPDCYINDLKYSVILEVKAAEIVTSENFATDCTLRFGRTVKIRYDKDWSEAMTKQQLDDMMVETNYTKTMKKRYEEASDSDDEKDNQENLGKRRRKDTINKKKDKKRDQVLDDFTAVDVSKEKLVSHLFHNKEFSVMQLEGCPYSTHEIERDILLNDGKIVKNALISTQFIVVNEKNSRVDCLQRYQGKKFTFIKPKYIKNCILAQTMLPLSPLYLTVLPSNTSNFYRDNFDKFGDSFTNPIDTRELNQILACMSDGYKINDQLVSVITLKHKRHTKISHCFNISQLDKVKLKYHGNRIVDSFEEKPNSIIVSKQSQMEEAAKLKIELYLENSGAELEYIENLKEEGII